MYTDGLTHDASWYDADMGVGGEPTRTVVPPQPGIFGDRTPAGVVPMDQGWANQEDAFSVLDRASPAVRQDAVRADRIAGERPPNIIPEASIRSRTVNDLLPDGIGPQEAVAEAERALGITPEGAPSLTPAFDALTPRQMAAGEPWSAPSPFEGVPGRELSLGPGITATDTEVASTPAGTEEVTATVTAPDMSGGRQGLRASTGGANIASQRAGAQSAGAAAMAAGKDAGLLGTGTQGEGAPPSGGLSGMSLASGIVGGVGIASAIANTITDFRTTADLEEMLAQSAAGDTVARQEGRLAGGQLQRNIMASSMGRRDISPALALRNAQQAVAPALSDTYAQAAIESARERRQSETQLAQLRKQRYDSLFGSLMQTAGTVGSLLATQGANQETEAMAKRVEALERRGLQDVTGGRRRG